MFDDDIQGFIFEEFKKLDTFYDEFADEFRHGLLLIIKTYYPDFIATENFGTQVNLYAKSMLSVTHSVIDKDKTYSEIRLKDELVAMQTYLAKAVTLSKNKELAAETHLKTKELVVKYYPAIIDLSADGFRLLELNLSFFNMEFVANFNRMDGM